MAYRHSPSCPGSTLRRDVSIPCLYLESVTGSALQAAELGFYAPLPPARGSSARLQPKVRWRNVGGRHPPSPAFPAGAVSLLHPESKEF